MLVQMEIIIPLRAVLRMNKHLKKHPYPKLQYSAVATSQYDHSDDPSAMAGLVKIGKS